VATFALVEEAIRNCVSAGASTSDDPHTDTWLLWAVFHGAATLEKPARSEYLRLGPLDRPAMLETLTRRIARLILSPYRGDRRLCLPVPPVDTGAISPGRRTPGRSAR
jgi:hypothetical protein